MQHVSEQKENKVSWLDQLGSWWDKNSTAITTGVMAIAIGTVAVMTVVATGGLAAPALAAAFAGALGTTYGALAASFVVSGIAAAGVTAAITGVVSLASTVPGLNQALSPTVNSTSFQMLQGGSMLIAGTCAAFLAQFAPTSNNKTQGQQTKEEETALPVKDNVVEGGTTNSSIDANELNEEPLYRVMSEAELDTVKEIGYLRGGREGVTYFTDSYYKDASNAQNRLSLPSKPEYIVEFKITNNPAVAGGNTVEPAYGGVSGGREYFSSDPIEVELLNYQKTK